MNLLNSEAARMDRGQGMKERPQWTAASGQDRRRLPVVDTTADGGIHLGGRVVRDKGLVKGGLRDSPDSAAAKVGGEGSTH